MTTVNYKGFTWNLPYRGRFGRQIRDTLSAIVDAYPDRIALYVAMNLHGRAARYADRYKAAFVRFARANAHLLGEGAAGTKGGYGFWPVAPSIEPTREQENADWDTNNAAEAERSRL